jgi:predicted CoA-binding protein
MNIQEQINLFLNSAAFGVVGASPKRNKYGNKVLRCYQQNQRNAYPVHPIHKEIEGIPCLQFVKDLPAEVQSISIITPSQVTERIVREALEKGIMNIWMQPGAESLDAIAFCKAHQINLIANGPCILVSLGFRELVFLSKL